MGLRSGTAWAVVLLSALCGPSPGQAMQLNGYVRAVPLAGTRDGQLGEFNRVRLFGESGVGAFGFGAAYEHVLTFRRHAEAPEFHLGAVPGGGEWLGLQWTVAERDHVVWQHRFDRLHVGWESERLEISVGRQAVSWGTALFLTPSDPFTPFNPVDPFREFRAGVDAARLRFFPGALSEVDLVVRPTRSPAGEEVVTALIRGLTTARNWELSAWGGIVYGDPAGALGAAGSVGGWAVRGEAVLRQLPDRVVFRGTLGLDRQLQVGGRDLTLAVEYQRDGLGADGPDAYLATLGSTAFLRGEHQVLGRDETVVRGTWQLHPLWSLSGLVLWNLNDLSATTGTSVAYSAGNDVAMTAGAFLGLGDDDATAARPLPSEYGSAGLSVYLSLSWYF
ncbi:hypothetical protein [Candidatus Palauibacter sp.]|uniref:hypothetical protein n=1 Tax=Candidatus Palauibacter sp. TaxID=3101350 RepID=UPI003B021F29